MRLRFAMLSYGQREREGKAGMRNAGAEQRTQQPAAFPGNAVTGL